jgi:hypothetical protein
VLLPGEPFSPPEPAGLPLLWVRVAAVPLLWLAVVVARRMPLTAAVVPAALGLAAAPEVVTGRLVLAQLVFAYLLGRRLESRRTVEPLLPAHPVGDAEHGDRPEHAPADPPGAGECRFYRASPHRLSPAYRLCFTGGRLSHKATVRIDD